MTSRRTWRSVLSSLALILGLGMLALLPTEASGQATLGSRNDAEQLTADAACAIPHQWLLRTWRGWRADRGAEIQMIAQEPNFVGSGLPHVGPWDYVQHVPMLWYGPGHVADAGVVQRPVTSAGIAPTAAALADYTGYAPIDGQPMREAIAKGAGAPPKLIVTLIWDAGGRNVLEAHPKDWPFLESLIKKGTWYENATVGSSPTSTAQIHATIGTGAFPDQHGLVGHRMRIGPEITTPWDRGPAYIDLPTFADLYDRAMGNEPLVGMMGTVSIHAGMLGHGAMWGGGDKDIAIFRQAEDQATLTDEAFNWNIPRGLAPYYEFPAYTNDVPGFDEDVKEVDQADGKLDGKWRRNEIEPLLGGFDTPARTPYQERVLEEVIRREGFGADEITDLLYVNHKIIDYISHVWTMDSREMKDAVRAEDASLETFVGFLDEQVGTGEWALLLTADHGAIPKPSISGAHQISTGAIAAGVNTRFDTDGDDVHVVDLVQPTGVFLNTKELKENGFAVAEVAQWISTLTKGQTADPTVEVPANEEADEVFQAVFASDSMLDLPCLPEAKGGYGA